jgi:hypothetical protein
VLHDGWFDLWLPVSSTQLFLIGRLRASVGFEPCRRIPSHRHLLSWTIFVNFILKQIKNLEYPSPLNLTCAIQVAKFPI